MKEQNIIQIINQLSEIKQKIAVENLEKKFERRFNRIFSILEDEGFIFQYPLGEKYNETRTDCEASIVGEASENMVIAQVIKPLIYKKSNDEVSLIQKAVVIVEKQIV